MNDEEIMRKFNETFSDDNQVVQNKEKEVVAPYKATMNQNVVPNNAVPNNAVSNNNDGKIPPLNSNTTNNVANNSNSAVNDTLNSSINVQPQVSNNVPNNVNYNYVETKEVQTKKTVSFKINKDLYPVFIIIGVLLLALFVFPAIYDFFTRV